MDEINHITRTDIINHYCSKYERCRYLEIGIGSGKNFDAIQAKRKTGIDAARLSYEPYMQMTSDEFFLVNNLGFHVIFIDGLHEYKQVSRDIRHALDLAILPKGTIIVHDCMPETELMAAPVKPSPFTPWCGEVYKAFLDLRRAGNYHCFVVDEDKGIGVIEMEGELWPVDIPQEYTFAEFKENAEKWLGLVEWKQ